MLLTQQERDKFVHYLLCCVDSDKKILEQMKEIQLPQQLYTMNEARITAFSFVIKELIDVETYTY